MFLDGILSTVLAAIAPPFSGSAVAWVLWLISASVTAFYLFLILSVRRAWSTGQAKISTDRAERACDTVLSICLALAAAVLTILPILGEKVAGTNYLIPVGSALVFFLTLLVFTIHLRFNFLWRMRKSFIVNADENMRFAYWLTTATSSLVLGVFQLAVLAIALALGWIPLK